MMGKVHSVSKINHRIAIETAGGKITVVEVLDPVDFAVGDVIRGDLESRGRETLKISGGATFEGDVKAIRLTRTEAAKLLRE